MLLCASLIALQSEVSGEEYWEYSEKKEPPGE